MSRADDEHAARCATEQKLSAIDKDIMAFKHNHNELIQKYLNENKNVRRLVGDKFNFEYNFFALFSLMNV